ncbi:MAG: metal-dependent hydrolase [Bdellovibrionota bacterium]
MKTKITYCGHSAALIDLPSGKRIGLDPWLHGNPSCPPHLLEPDRLDYIGLTHGHSDHAGGVVPLAKRLKSKVFATFELGNLLVADGLDASQYLPMNKGGTIELESDLSATLTQAFHSSSYDAADGKTYYAGEPCGIVIRSSTSPTIYHAGDTLLFSDMAIIGKKFRPALVMVPIGDRFTMGPEDAAEAVALLSPQFVIPIHYATFPLLSGSSEDFSRKVEQKAPKTKVIALSPGETFDL